MQPPLYKKIWQAVAPKQVVRIIPLSADKYLDVKEPHVLFLSWFQQALDKSAHLRPNLACMSTVNRVGKPTARIIKIEDLNDNSLKFYTSYNSRKATELASNPNVSIFFHWPQISRGVRIDGTAKRLKTAESRAQFQRYSRDHQLSICARQNGGKVLKKHLFDKIIDQVSALLNKHEQMPMPDNWGGFNIVPKMYEFCELKNSSRFPRLRFHRGKEAIDVKNPTAGAKGWSCEHCAH